MQIPTCFYGSYKSVQRNCQKLIKRIAKGESWQTVFSEIDRIEIEANPGSLILDGPDPGVRASENHFHCFVLVREMGKAHYPEERSLEFVSSAYRKVRLAEEMLSPIYEAALQTEWGFLNLLCRQNYLFINQKILKHPYACQELEDLRFRPFLHACSRYWPTLNQFGNRYAYGSCNDDLWKVPNFIHFTLARMGVPNETLQQPLPDGDIQPLIELALQGHLQQID
jgi:hypothetical protein